MWSVDLNPEISVHEVGKVEKNSGGVLLSTVDTVGL